MNNIFSFLLIIVILPLLASFFILMCKENKNQSQNIYNVSILAIVANMIIIWRFFTLLDVNSKALQLVTKIEWLKQPKIDLIFGADLFSLLLILAIHFAFLIILTGLKENLEKPKTMAILVMVFISMITGFLISGDIFSFYMFFEAMLLPLFLMTGIAGEVKKQESIYRFFLYNIFGAILLFVATSVLYNYSKGSIEISSVHELKFSNPTEYFIWGSIFLALLSRLPLWPFHYWIASINTGIKNPLVFLTSNLIPLTAIYGLIRLLPVNVAVQISIVTMILEILAVISIGFIALIGFVNKDFQYKIFSYISIYYIFYLLAILITKETVLLNIGFAFFAFLISISAIEVIWYKISHNKEVQNKSLYGILQNTPKLYFAFAFFALALAGAPLSSMFLNNFVIISKIIEQNVVIAIIIAASLLISAASLIGEMIKLKQGPKSEVALPDLQNAFWCFMLFVIFVLLMSFIKPLWFAGF